MSTVSQNPSLTSPSKYEPRYAVGDRYSDGLGAVWEITEIHRASVDDGHSSAWAVRDGFTTYGSRAVVGTRHDVITTSFLHELIDTRCFQWAYVGPTSDASDNTEGGAR